MHKGGKLGDRKEIEGIVETWVETLVETRVQIHYVKRFFDDGVSFTARWEIHHRPTDKLADDRTLLSLGGKLDRSKLAFHRVEIKLDNLTEEPESNVAILSR